MLSNKFITLYKNLLILKGKNPKIITLKNIKDDSNLPFGANQINCKTVVFPKSQRNIKIRVATLFLSIADFRNFFGPFYTSNLLNKIILLECSQIR